MWKCSAIGRWWFSAFGNAMTLPELESAKPPVSTALVFLSIGRFARVPSRRRWRRELQTSKSMGALPDSDGALSPSDRKRVRTPSLFSAAAWSDVGRRAVYLRWLRWGCWSFFFAEWGGCWLSAVAWFPCRKDEAGWCCQWFPMTLNRAKLLNHICHLLPVPYTTIYYHIYSRLQ